MSANKYKPEYCKLIVDIMSQGDPLVSFAAKVGVGKRTVYDWIKRHPEFAEAHEKAKAACEHWWATTGKEGMFMGGKDNPFQSAIWNFNMSARFGWSQKKETKIESDSLAALIMETVKDDDKD